MFKKKDSKPVAPIPKPTPSTSPDAKNTIRETLFGDVSPDEWPKSNMDGFPWSMFVEARDEITQKGNLQGAIRVYKKIIEMPGLESRHYLQAWNFLRKLNVEPIPEVGKKVYGIVIDVVLQNGTEFVAAYADHRARYFNYTGSGIVWDAPDSSLNEQVDTLLKACEVAAGQIPPIAGNIRPTPPKQVDAVQICILTPGGLHHSIGTFDGWAKEPTRGPILAATANLMKSLVAKNLSNK